MLKIIDKKEANKRKENKNNILKCFSSIVAEISLTNTFGTNTPFPENACVAVFQQGFTNLLAHFLYS